jgi:hypothetical protein
VAGGTRSLPHALRNFAWALAAMAVVSLVYSIAITHLLHAPHPYGVTLFRDNFVGSDFTTFAERSRHFGTPSYWDEFNYPFTYPAPLGVVFALLFRLPHPLAMYLGLCIAGLICWAVWLARGLASAGLRSAHAIAFVVLILTASWPVVALFNTANIEGLVAIVLAAGVYAVLRERFWLGATLIGVAASMKLFPFIPLALLLSRRRYREFAWGLAVAAISTLGSLAVLGPTILAAQRHIADGLRFINEAFILSTRADALNYSHSLFSLLKFAIFVLARMNGSHTSEALLNSTLRVYMVVAAIAGVALYFAVIRKLPILNQVLALTICAVLLPPLSADYTLLELLLPFGLLCFYAVETRRDDLGPCFGCFAVIFAWETFLTLHYAFDRPVRTVALSVLLILLLSTPLPWSRLDAAEATA